MNCFRRGFKFYPAAVLFKILLGLIRQSHATVVAVSNNQQLGPFLVNIPSLMERNHMRGAVNLFWQLLLAFFNRAIQPQDDIVSGEALPVPSFLRTLRPPLPNRVHACPPIVIQIKFLDCVISPPLSITYYMYALLKGILLTLLKKLSESRPLVSKCTFFLPI